MKIKNQKKYNGFTLIELLVVIAIIAMLLSILMPALGAAKRQAQKAVCMTNLSQWGILFTLYTEDNDDLFFPGYYQHDDPDGNALEGQDSDTWPYAMRPYYQDSSLRFCPSARQKRGQTWGSDSDDTFSGSYGLNGWVCNPPEEIAKIDGHDTQNHWRAMYVKSNRSKIPLMADAMWFTGLPEDDDLPAQEEGNNSDWSEQSENQMQRFCVDRHRQKMNILFLDSSIKAISPKELWRLKWHRTFDTTTALPEWPEWMSRFKDPE